MDADMLKGRCALVTGSLGGIGFATASALANRGCDVMIHGLADPAHAEGVRVKLAEATGVKVAVSNADLSHLEEIDQLVAEAQAALGPIDILVNNAVTRHAGPVEDIPITTWSLALAVNLTAPFRLIQLTLPGMKKRGWGRIINIASNWGLTGTRNRSDYVATKHGLVGLTRAVALEALPFGVTCNAVAPGATLTPNARRQLDELARSSGDEPEKVVQTFLGTRQPSGRFVMPEDVAELIVFLCGTAAREMTGSPISIDGGWVAM
jgi:3-hydroxybutyrate dehydrogenase